MTQFPPGIIKVSSDLYLISTSAHTHILSCDILEYSSTTPSSVKDLSSSPRGTTHKSLNSSAFIATAEFLPGHPSYGHVIITHTACYCTACTNLALLCKLAGWIVWQHLVSVCCLATPPSPPPPVCVCATFRSKNGSIIKTLSAAVRSSMHTRQRGKPQRRMCRIAVL